MDHYNYVNKPFDMIVVHEQLNCCHFLSDSVDDDTMDKLGMEICKPVSNNEDNFSNLFQDSAIFKSLSLEAALMTSSEERTKAISRVFYTISHLLSRNIIIKILMSLTNWTFEEETEEKIVWKLDELGFTNVSKIVQFIRLLLIMNVWTDREFKENEIRANLLEHNVLELLSNTIVSLAEHFRPAYNFLISIPVQVRIFIAYTNLENINNFRKKCLCKLLECIKNSGMSFKL